MKNIQELTTDDTIHWLLEDTNPSVKYLTLTDLLDKNLSDDEVKNTKEQIMTTGVVPKLLQKQEQGGYWNTPEMFYRAKYKGTVWTILILAELFADANDPRIKNTCEFLLQHAQDKQTGGFSVDSAKKGGGIPGKVIPCLTGNMVFSFLRFGYQQDPRIQQAINWITTYQRFDDGQQNLPPDWHYKNLKACFSTHSCHMGVVKSLKALAEIPSNNRTSEINHTIQQAVDYLLLHHIYKKSHDLSKPSKLGWLRLGFPHMYQTDILEILDILIKLGVKDERMQDAINIIYSKKDTQGRWLLEDTFNGKFNTTIETKAKPSKWITLNALRVLKKNITMN